MDRLKIIQIVNMKEELKIKVLVVTRNSPIFLNVLMVFPIQTVRKKKRAKKKVTMNIYLKEAGLV